MKRGKGQNVALRELHLFAGAGGGILGGMLCGHIPVCAVELEEYPRKVLMQRQQDGILPWFPIWDDVCTFDGTEWRGKVDVVCGGFPCQDISAAGKGAGLAGERSGLWLEMARIIGEVRPRFVFVENSPLLVSRGLDRVLSDLAEMGYDARWGVVGGNHCGLYTRRERLWILASSDRQRWHAPVFQKELYNKKHKGWPPAPVECVGHPDGRTRRALPADIRVRDELADYVGQSKAIGNGQVPAVAALAWRILADGLTLV